MYMQSTTTNIYCFRYPRLLCRAIPVAGAATISFGLQFQPGQRGGPSRFIRLILTLTYGDMFARALVCFGNGKTCSLYQYSISNCFYLVKKVWTIGASQSHLSLCVYHLRKKKNVTEKRLLLRILFLDVYFPFIIFLFLLFNRFNEKNLSMRNVKAPCKVFFCSCVCTLTPKQYVFHADHRLLLSFYLYLV